MKIYYMSILDEFNSLLTVAKFNEPIPATKEMFQFFDGEPSVSIIGNKNTLYFNERISNLYRHDNDVYRTIGLKSFREKVVELLKTKNRSDSSFLQIEVDDFYNYFRTIDVQEFRVMRGIYGITLNTENQYRLGTFNIYAMNIHALRIQTQLGLLAESFLDKMPEYMIECRILCRDSAKAIELAETYFLRLTLFLKYMIGMQDPYYNVEIIDATFPYYDGTLISTKKGVNRIGYALRNQRRPIEIQDPYFTDIGNGNQKLLEIITKTNPTKFEKRIINSVEWIGKSLSEKDIQVAFIQIAIAVEIIFTVQEKTIITPSILSQISESIALILGKELNSRLEIEKQIKSLYSIRSAIVHAGKDDIDKNDYLIFLTYAKEIVIELLINPEMSNVHSVEDFYQYIKKLKYT
ncbi:MAG: hypothetical protein HYV28_00725 [Ignavibacteriales bacterium]|nr:hypothetical protein [Ignavibacteriales bacterium]